jgi:hypothetical protein
VFLVYRNSALTQLLREPAREVDVYVSSLIQLQAPKLKTVDLSDTVSWNSGVTLKPSAVTPSWNV